MDCYCWIWRSDCELNVALLFFFFQQKKPLSAIIKEVCEGWVYIYISSFSTTNYVSLSPVCLPVFVTVGCFWLVFPSGIGFETSLSLSCGLQVVLGEPWKLCSANCGCYEFLHHRKGQTSVSRQEVGKEFTPCSGKLPDVFLLFLNVLNRIAMTSRMAPYCAWPHLL